jgi:hypothetical protein
MLLCFFALAASWAFLEFLVAGLFVGFTPLSTAATLTSYVSKEGKVVLIFREGK